jgi:NAD(P)H dehydrogenase (quinone)
MIFLTGGAGKTGKAIIRALSLKGITVKVLVHSEQQAESLASFNNVEICIGDLRDPQLLERSIKGVDQLYYICPNISPDELVIGNVLIDIAKKHRLSRFVYHSVLHPQIEIMPHHWQKMRMEEALFTSGLDFTILQPCAYMQNILSGWHKITLEKQYNVPYRVSTQISMVDLDDIARVAAKLLTENSYSNAIYELAGPEPLSQTLVAEQLSTALGYSVRAVEQSREEWGQNARKNNLQGQQIETLIKMFEYYDKYGFIGNSSILEYLLGQKPVTFRQFLTHFVESGDEK